jgi:hypothetical protein
MLNVRPSSTDVRVPVFVFGLLLHAHVDAPGEVRCMCIRLTGSAQKPSTRLRVQSIADLCCVLCDYGCVSSGGFFFSRRMFDVILKKVIGY